jgi:carbonic anhydrase
MSKRFLITGAMLFTLLFTGNALCSEVKHVEQTNSKPNATQALQLLKDGNARFVAGKAENPHSDIARANLAGKSNQGDYAYATIISCSDSRVPVERIFDAGIMDLFIIRVAGNVVDGDEAGSIEYGLAHVNTPLLVVLGHTQCGAVTAVAAAVEGHGHALERNIPALVDNIQPAVIRAQKHHPELQGKELLPFGIEENVWQGIEDLFMRSPATRDLVKAGKVKVVGAIYDVANGSVNWLPDARVAEIHASVEKNPSREKESMAGGTKHAH